MLRIARFVLLVNMLLSSATVFAQRQTTWVGGAGEWFESRKWTNGVPNPNVVASIPDGEVVVPAGTESPQVLRLDLARVDQDSGRATLAVSDGNLWVTTRLVVGESHESTASGHLQVLGRRADSGNIFVDDLVIGVSGGTGEAEGAVELTGDLRPNGKELSSLLVGAGAGLAFGKLNVERSIGNLELGYATVTIGHATDAGAEVFGDVSASSLSFAGGQLTVGLNTSKSGDSFASGQLAVTELNGYEKAFFGMTEVGRASATVHVESLYNVRETVLGTPNGVGQARLTLGDQATLTGQLLVVNPSSSISLGDQVDAMFLNSGRALVTNRPDGLPGGIVKMSNVVTQSPTGVLELDVVGPQRGVQYEAVDIADGGSLQGRLQINFGADYQPRLGDAFEFVRSEGPLEVKELGWQLRNAPQNLAVEFQSSDNALVAKFVEPAQQDFADVAGSDFSWQDSAIWTNQAPPDSTQDVGMINHRAAEQTVRAVPGAIARSLTIDGAQSSMILSIAEDSSLTATHGVHVKSLGQIVMGGGRLVTDTLRLDAEAILRGSGQIAGDVVNQGFLGVGLASAEPGLLMIDGSLTQLPQSWLEMDVLGVDEGQFDRIRVEGTVNLAGTLNLNLGNLDAIGPNVRIPLIEATGGILGDLKFQFENQVGEIPFGLDTFVDPDSGETTIMFISGPGPGILGDMNWDLSVDECDLDAFALSLQDVDTYTDFYVFEPSHIGDINDDGVFDVDDIQPFFELVNGVGCASEALPEPNSHVLVMFACVFALRMRIRRMGAYDVG